MSTSRTLTVVAACVAGGLTARALPGPTTIYVDDDTCPDTGSGTETDPYCAIQTAIDNAADGDEIVVAPGTYFETIDLLGKAVVLHSSGGPRVTIIDAEQRGSVVTCENGEGPDTVLTGFTITGGAAEAGGGMLIFEASPTVTNCVFTDNVAEDTHLGGGMLIIGAPTVANCNFVHNAAGAGGGIGVSGGSSATINNCTFIENSAGMSGGGMHVQQSSDVTVNNCTFARNTADEGGAISNSALSTATVTNCILWGDSPTEIAEFGGAVTEVLYCDVRGGFPGTGNIDARPLFADRLSGDFRLRPDSPCIDAGDNDSVPRNITRDLDGKPRFRVGSRAPHLDDAPRVDMGAYEYQSES